MYYLLRVKVKEDPLRISPMNGKLQNLCQQDLVQIEFWITTCTLNENKNQDISNMMFVYF